MPSISILENMSDPNYLIGRCTKCGCKQGVPPRTDQSGTTLHPSSIYIFAENCFFPSCGHSIQDHEFENLAQPKKASDGVDATSASFNLKAAVRSRDENVAAATAVSERLASKNVTVRGETLQTFKPTKKKASSSMISAEVMERFSP